MKLFKCFFLFFSLFVVLSGDVWGDYKVWKVSQSGKKIILEMDKNEILTKGDRLHLQNNLGKCWLQVVKVKSPYALVAADRCLFTIEKGNLMVHSQYFSSLPKLGFEEDKKELSIQETRAQEPVVLLPRIRSKKKYSFHSLASLGYFPYDQFSFDHPTLDKDVDIERVLSFRSDTVFRRPSWNHFGIGGGFFYNVEREIDLPGDPSFSLLSLHSNLSYFMRDDFYFSGGPNFSVPLFLEKFKGASNFESFPGFGFQVGATFLLEKILGVSLEYRRTQFYSSQSEKDQSSSTGKKKTVGTYTIHGLSISVGFPFF